MGMMLSPVLLRNPNTGYTIKNAMLFDGASSLSRTPISAGNRRTFTISFWEKLCTDSTAEYILSAGNAGSPYDGIFAINTHTSSAIGHEVYHDGSGLGANNYTYEDGADRDVGAWRHVCVAFDATANACDLYINGVLQSNPSSTSVDNIDYYWNATVTHYIGQASYGAARYFNGYLTEFHMVDGQALDASSFGETVKGVWVPIEYKGTYGANGFYLDGSSRASANVKDATYSNLAGGPGGAWGFTNPCTMIDLDTRLQNGANVTDVGFWVNGSRSVTVGIVERTSAGNFTVLGSTTVTSTGLNTYEYASLPLTIPATGDHYLYITGNLGSPNNWYAGYGNYVAYGNGVGPVTSGVFSLTEYPAPSTQYCPAIAMKSDDDRIVFTNSGVSFGVLDSPTDSVANGVGNFCTFNPLIPSNLALSEGNTKVTSGTAAWNSVLGTIGANSGKFICSFNYITQPGAGDFMHIGIAPLGQAGTVASTYLGAASSGNSIDYNNGSGVYINGSLQGGTFAAYTPGDAIDVAMDLDNGFVYFRKNGVWQNSGDPESGALGTGGIAIPTGETDWSFATSGYSGSVSTANFNGDAYAIPAGYTALNTTNLQSPVLANWQDVFAQVADTETNVDATLATAISNQGWGSNETVIFKKNFPGVESWAWAFSYDGSNEHTIAASSHGYTTKRAMSGANTWLACAFRIGAAFGTYAGAVSHTSGADTTVTHNLGTDDHAIFLFPRSSGTVYWYHPKLTAGNLMRLEQAAAQTASSAIKNVGVNSFDIDTGQVTGTYDVLVLSANDAIALTEYTGNGSADGPFNYEGHAPVMQINHCYSGTTSYATIHSAALEDGNPIDQYLIWNYENAGGTGTNYDFVSNGQKLRTTGVSLNASGSKYLSISVGAPFSLNNRAR